MNFNSALNALTVENNNIVSYALRSTEGYSSYGPTMAKLAKECLDYWLSVATNGGTIEDSRELSEVLDHYNEEPNPTSDEKISLLGELWNYETHGDSASLDEHIDNWCMHVGYSVRSALESHMKDLED